MEEMLRLQSLIAGTAQRFGIDVGRTCHEDGPIQSGYSRDVHTAESSGVGIILAIRPRVQSIDVRFVH